MRSKIPPDWPWFFASQLRKSPDDVKVIVFMKIPWPFLNNALTVYQLTLSRSSAIPIERYAFRYVIKDARTHYFAHYDMLRSTACSRKRFLTRVDWTIESF